MTYGFLVTNSAGKEIIYGKEYIPVCVWAGYLNVSLSRSGYVDLGASYEGDYIIFARHVSGSVVAPTLYASNSRGKIRVNWSAKPSSASQAPQGVLPSGKIKVYVVGRTPRNTNISGKWGVALYDSDGKLVFTGTLPPAPIIGMNSKQKGYPRFGAHSAVIPNRCRQKTEAHGVMRPSGTDEYYYNCIVSGSGVVTYGVSIYMNTVPQPEAASGAWDIPYALIAIDTTHADRIWK
ncbi:hypothetical protein AB733_11665 [Photobacterium swingsii]|uniref:Uncharacterized protein n=1 Tax=Photobacterium swingsii TaxID=680026 RepID=A0A0J8VAM8_9GAMM|nr:hypothetical protein [Photobacterium swingsii]KMV30336.1 hypothetical protein AB733_11665 [Photobacterium swingsii]PSW24501.1 hypothetical protein C9I94_10720 [Photobacterium swingsii]